MSNENLLGLALRFLPALIVFVLAFVAASDLKSRERWADLMYQMGSVRSDQRSDPKVQRGVRWPFFAVAVALLAWPFLFYRHATRTLEVKSDIYSQPQKASTIYDQAPISNSVGNAATIAPSTTGAATAAPSAGTDIYGRPR